jgi:hypothetical protein
MVQSSKKKPRKRKSKPTASDKSEPSSPKMDLCSFCVERETDAGIVHGNVVHRICCYRCAKRIFKRRQPCPVCRQKIEKVAKIVVLG